MTNERWDSLVARLMDRYPDTRFQKFTEQNDWGVEERHEVLIFRNTEDKKFELERVTRPRVEDRKITYNKRHAGSQETVIYSQTEFVNFVKLFRLDGDEWVEIDLNSIEG